MNDKRRKAIHDAAEQLKGIFTELDYIERDLKKLQREEQRILDTIPEAQQNRLDVRQCEVAVYRVNTVCASLSDILDALEDDIRSLDRIK